MSDGEDTGGSQAGRPSSYLPEYATQAEKLCLLGATDVEIADFFEIAVSTFYKWKHEHSEFSEAIKGGKEVADDRVERSLFHKAVGYKFDAVKIFMPANAVAPVYAPYREHVPPDTTAMIFWLKNRRPEAWRDKREHEHSGKDGAPIKIERIERIIVDPAARDPEGI